MTRRCDRQSRVAVAISRKLRVSDSAETRDALKMGPVFVRKHLGTHRFAATGKAGKATVLERVGTGRPMTGPLSLPVSF